jgi:uncharacterized protein (TIGR02594 family)
MNEREDEITKRIGIPRPEPLDKEPAWLAIARRELGVHETPGPGSTSRINDYLAVAHAAPNDETPWCSAFACWAMQGAGLEQPHRLAARSWLKWGTAIAEPRLGCVVVLWRDDPSSAHGHVAFFVREDAANVYLLGGNQANSVCVRAYPKRRVLGYRWPS